MAPAIVTYAPRDPRRTVLSKVIADPRATFRASFEANPDATGLPAYVERALYDSLLCGSLAHGFLRQGCDPCDQELWRACSGKCRRVCPACTGQRMAQMAVHLVERVISWVPTR